MRIDTDGKLILDTEPLALLPVSFICSYFGRSRNAINAWVLRYSLTRFDKDGKRLKVKTGGQLWLSGVEIIDKVPSRVRHRALERKTLTNTTTTTQP